MSRILSIAINTYRESVRSKILYALLFFAVSVVLISSIFGSVTIGDRVKVVKDFSLFSMSFFCVAYAVIAGSSLLYKELKGRTIFNILAKPVKRSDFIVGKYFGMLLTVVLLQVLMTTALQIFLVLLEFKIDYLIFYAAYSIFLQLSIVCAYTIFFSSIVVTPLLSGAFAFGIFLAGRSSAYILSLLQSVSHSKVLVFLLKFVYSFVPHLDYIDLSNQVVYSKNTPIEQVAYASVYSLAYVAILLLLSVVFFERKEFK